MISEKKFVMNTKFIQDFISFDMPLKKHCQCLYFLFATLSLNSGLEYLSIIQK